MNILEILKYPDPVLKAHAAPVDVVDEAVINLIDDMIETMYNARGIGLAAVQVGVARRVIILDIPEDEDEPRERGKHLVALVNPEIKKAEGSTKYEEGCLSVPGVTADVIRAERVVVEALDRTGQKTGVEAEGLFAIALQHEIDHLDGILFIERLSRLKRDMVKKKLKKALEAEERAL